MTASKLEFKTLMFFCIKYGFSEGMAEESDMVLEKDDGGVDDDVR